MAILKMTKMRLVVIDYYKDQIFNALHKTGAFELSGTEQFADTFSAFDNLTVEELNKKFSRVSKSVEFITDSVALCKGKDYYPANTDQLFENFFVSYQDFSDISKREQKLFEIVEFCEKSEQTLSANKSLRIKLNNLINQIAPYSVITDKFSDYKDTEKTCVLLGTVKKDVVNALSQELSQISNVHYSLTDSGSVYVLSAVALKEFSEQLLTKLNEFGFVRCPFDFELCAQEKILDIKKEIKESYKIDEQVLRDVCVKANDVKELKILADNLNFSLEKASSSDKFRKTGKTVILEGFVPECKKDEVSQAINQVTNANFIEFIEPSDDDDVPTLTKNGYLVRQTEFVTDLYSVPNYKEMDPNKVTFFFFMLFMGIIMADVGYGVLMVVLGFFLASRIKVDNGTKRLWNVIALGGVFTIIFGLLFNSFFGVAVLPVTLIPSPTPDLNTGEINLETIMILLLASLGLGVVQIAVGYFCKAINCFMQKDIAGGIFDGLIWVIFFISFVLAAFNFLCDYLGVGLSTGIRNFFASVQTPALYTLIGSVVVAAVAAGREEKGFGKFSKGFGTVYGLINIMSDVLSYARLFGLMLSGMIIAQTFNYKLGLPLIQGGGVGVVFGSVVIVIGHVFNIAMNVLGAYIHDSRLQYIEFFSKFYTGEGRKFTPIGSQMKYVYLKKN